MRDAHSLASLLTRGLLAALFVRRTSFDQQPPASCRQGDINFAAAARDPLRAHALEVGAVLLAVPQSGARAVVLYFCARGAFVAREREAGLEAAAMCYPVGVPLCNRM